MKKHISAFPAFTKRISFFVSALLCLLFSAGSLRAAGINDWTAHLAYHNATYSLVAGEKVYALYEANLLEYDRAVGEVTLHSRLTGLSETDIRFIAYDSSTEMLAIVYASGNIDFLEKSSGKVLNMQDFKRLTEGNVEVNSLNVVGGELLISTEKGVARVNIEERSIIAYYDLGTKVYDATISGGMIYAACGEEIRSCALSDNPLDPASWSNFRACSAWKMLNFVDGFYFLVNDKEDAAGSGIWWVKRNVQTGEHAVSQLTTDTYTMCSATDETALFANTYKCICYKKIDPKAFHKQWPQVNSWKSVAQGAEQTYWVANNNFGLQEFGWDEQNTQLKPTGFSISGMGPRRDWCYYTTFVNGRLLVAGGRLDPADRKHYPGTAMQYDGTWKYFNDEGFASVHFFRLRGDLTCIVQDPKDPTHHFAASGGMGLFEYRDYKVVEQYNTGNSALRSAASNGSPYYVRVDGLNYDSEGNLWMLNCEQDSVIKVLKKNGDWVSILAKGLEKAPTLEKAMFDSKGRFWVCSRATSAAHTSGLFCLEYGGKLASASKDNQKMRSSANNQDGKHCTLENVYSIVEDKNGEIWFGTSSGLYVISNPDEWMNSDFRITQVKVPRNDGTNLADYLLSGVGVTAIAIDGGNRKWIGTESSGLYLVSPDGTQVLEQFTMENSPLLSNGILSLSVDPNSGEVYIGTTNGMISYSSGITEAEPGLEESKVKVYPNPVRPEHTQGVTVTGLTDGAEVKITTLGGQVVSGGYATGGSYIWDVRGTNGERVGTGVYLILATTAEGKDGVAAKVVVI